LGPAKVGLFNKAFSLRSIPDDVLLGSAYQTVFRALSKEQDDRSKSQYIFYRSITLLSVYTWPVYIGFWWVANPLINVLYGAKWIAAAEPLKILSLIGLLYCIGYQSGAVIAAQNRLGRELIIQIEKMILLGIGCYIGMRWGLSGVAWSMFPVHIYTTIRTFRLANSCIGTSFFDLLLALKPAIILNIILFVGLFLFDMIFYYFFDFSNEFIYLGYMIFIGVLIYSLSFLYLPITSLSTEADRWKKYLKLIPVN
jgi:O-antigen/teichoic acid export membrane protein